MWAGLSLAGPLAPGFRQVDTPLPHLEVLGGRFSPIADDFIFDVLTFIEGIEAGPLHRRDVYEHILPAALRLDKAIAFGWIEPFHRSSRHYRLQNIEPPVYSAAK